MAKPTDWQPAKDGLGETRRTGNGNVLHRQHTPDGPVTHLNRPGGTSERLPSSTIDPPKTPPKSPK